MELNVNWTNIRLKTCNAAAHTMKINFTLHYYGNGSGNRSRHSPTHNREQETEEEQSRWKRKSCWCRLCSQRLDLISHNQNNDTHYLQTTHVTDSGQIKQNDFQNYSNGTILVQKQSNLNLFCGRYHNSTHKKRKIASDLILIKTNKKEKKSWLEKFK